MADRESEYFVVFFEFDNSLQNLKKRRLNWPSSDNETCTVDFSTSTLDDEGVERTEDRPYDGHAIFSGSFTSCRSFLTQASEEIDLTNESALAKLKDLAREKKASGKRGASVKFLRAIQQCDEVQTKNQSAKQKKKATDETSEEVSKPKKKKKQDSNEVNPKGKIGDSRKKSCLPPSKLAEIHSFIQFSQDSKSAETTPVKGSGSPQNTLPCATPSSTRKRRLEHSTPRSCSPIVKQDKSPSVVRTTARKSLYCVTEKKEQQKKKGILTETATTSSNSIKSPPADTGFQQHVTKMIQKETNSTKLTRSPVRATKVPQQVNKEVSRTGKKSPSKSTKSPVRGTGSPQHTTTVMSPKGKSSPSKSTKSPVRSSGSLQHTTKVMSPKGRSSTNNPNKLPVRKTLPQLITESFNILEGDICESPVEATTTPTQLPSPPQCYGEFGYNASSSFSPNSSFVSMLEASDSVIDYYQGLTLSQKSAVLGLISFLQNKLRGCDMSVEPLTSFSASAESVSISSARTEMIEELKVPLVIDKDNKFSDVLVNPSKIREAEIKCSNAKIPERYLLNKVLEQVFTPEEFSAARGTKALNQHKQEAVKEYMNAKCQALNLGKSEGFYTAIVQNKIGNMRYKSKPVLRKTKNRIENKTKLTPMSSKGPEVAVPSGIEVTLQGSPL